MLNNYKKIIIITFSEININSVSATTYVGIKILVFTSITIRKPTSNVTI